MKATLTSASALAETGRYEAVWIESLAWQTNLGGVVRQLREQGMLHPAVKVRSVLPLLDDSPRDDRRPQEEDLLDLSGVTVVDAEGRRQDLVRDGVQVARIERNARGVLRKVAHLDPGGHVRRVEELVPAGRLVRVRDYHDDGTATERWLARDGSDLYRVELGTENEWLGVTLHPGGAEERLTPGDLHVRALERALAHSDRPILFSSFREPLPRFPERTMDSIAESVQHPRVRRVAVLHSNHRTTPYGPGARTKPHFQSLIDAAERWDAFVVLTGQQRDDIVAEHDPKTLIRVIGNIHDAGPVEVAEDADDPTRFVMAARIAPFKRINLAIKMMALVVEQVPEARLDIYGYGNGDDLERNVRALVVDLGLEEHVHFVGFAKNPADIFAGAAGTVMTSVSEAFPLILLESMSFGTPILSFDTPYGPGEVVRDGENGFLVPVGDIEALAARLIQVTRDAELRRRLRAGAAATPARFSRAEFVRRWVELVSAVEPPQPPLPIRVRRRLGRLKRRLQR